MDKKPDSLNDLFHQAGNRPRLVTEDHVRTMLSADNARLGNTSRIRVRNAAMILTGMIASVSAYMLLAHTSPLPESGTQKSESDHYRTELIRDFVSGDSLVVLIPTKAGGTDIEPGPVKPASIDGINMLELTAGELSALGIRHDSDAVYLHYLDESGKIRELSTGIYGTGYRVVTGTDATGGLAVPTFTPAVITDDLGQYRSLSYDGEDIDSALAARIKQLSPESPEYFKLSMEMVRKAEKRATQRFNALVPIMVRSGRAYTTTDSMAHRWRPDLILWYEPTPEFLAMLPDRVRHDLATEVERVQHTVKEPTVQHSAGSVRKPHKSNEEVKGEKNVPLVKQDQIVDTTTNDQTVVPSDQAVAGRSYMDVSRSNDGAIVSTTLAPNPAHETTMLLVRLDAPRHITVTLHDISGRTLREIAQVEVTEAGERGIAIDLKGVRGGIYLIAVTTDKGERAVQRLALTQ